jgi:hypothetical protein
MCATVVLERLISSEFVLRLHQVCNAAMEVFNLSHSRSRLWFDRTVLQTRRVLIVDRQIPIVPSYSLRHTRIEALARYSRYLSERNFLKLVSLLRDLPPSLVVSAKRENGSSRRQAVATADSITASSDPANETVRGATSGVE